MLREMSMLQIIADHRMFFLSLSHHHHLTDSSSSFGGNGEAEIMHHKSSSHNSSSSSNMNFQKNNSRENRPPVYNAEDYVAGLKRVCKLTGLQLYLNSNAVSTNGGNGCILSFFICF